MDVARRWSRTGPGLVVVTRGSDGCVAITRGGELTVPAVTVDVVDTVGAGDTIMAALNDGLLCEGAFGATARTEIESLEASRLTALHRSAAAAAVTVSRPGADPPTRIELESATPSHV